MKSHADRLLNIEENLPIHSIPLIYLDLRGANYTEVNGMVKKLLNF